MYKINLDINNYFKKLFLFELLKSNKQILLEYDNQIISGIFTDPALKIELEHIKHSQNILESIVHHTEIITNRNILINIYNDCAERIIKQYYLFHPEYEEICSTDELMNFLTNSNSIEKALKERKQIDNDILEEVRHFFKKTIKPIL